MLAARSSALVQTTVRPKGSLRRPSPSGQEELKAISTI